MLKWQFTSYLFQLTLLEEIKIFGIENVDFQCSLGWNSFLYTVIMGQNPGELVDAQISIKLR